MNLVWEFIKAVCEHWVALLTGCVFLVLLSIWQSTGHLVAPWPYWTLVVGCVVAAFYRTWLDERRSVVEITEKLKEEIAKKDRPQITVLIHGDNGHLGFCLMNYTNALATNFRIDDIVCGHEILRCDPPSQITASYSPTIECYWPERCGDSRTDIALACESYRKTGSDISETLHLAIHYSDSSGENYWTTFCNFTYDFTKKKFVLLQQWITRSREGKPGGGVVVRGMLAGK